MDLATDDPFSHPAAHLRAAGTVVVRPRLHARLARATERPFTVVSGPAGSGKSVLVASWLRDAGWEGPVAWIAAADDRRVARRPWVALAPVLGLDAPPPPATRGPPDGDDAFVEAAVDRLGRLGAPALLVVDDHHRVHAAALERLAGLSTAASSGLRIVLAGRGAPALRVPDDCVVLRRRDLAFNAQETGAYLSAVGVQLSDRAFRVLCAASEGWAIALRLTVRPPGGRDTAARREAGAALARYVRDEVLGGLSSSERHVLARTCVVEQVSGPLARLLSARADAESVLRRLEAVDALVEATDPTRTVFRYHPLLRSVLLRDLRRRGPGRAEQLHRIAARWYAERGQVSAAIRHAHAGRDRSHTDTLVRRHWFVGLLGRERSTIDAALTALRRAGTPVDTELAAIIAAYRAAAGDWTEAADWLARARRLAEADGDALGHRERLALASARLIVAHAPAGVAEPPGVPEAGGEGPVEPLSERERGVLRLLPTHLTAEEIAEELSLSVNTVKTHMRSLYAKLGVHRRADAVAQARALGVLDFW